MQIFISHAVADKEIAGKLTELLEIGMGVPGEKIFISSQAGSIQNGEFFVEKILSRLISADLVVCVISPAYLKSQFCLAEAGAAMVKKIGFKYVVLSDTMMNAGMIAPALVGAIAGMGIGKPKIGEIKSKVFSCIVPPASFSDIGGVLHGVESGAITTRQTITELREVVRTGYGHQQVPEVKWSSRLDAFIDFVESYVRKSKTADAVKLIDVAVELREDLVHKKKLIFTFKSEVAVEVGPSFWAGNISLQHDFNPLRMKSYDGSKWSEDQDSVTVKAGGVFSVWINVLQAVPDSELLKRLALKSLGDLMMTVRIDGVATEKKISF